jgi:hypothetical protein
MPQRTDILPTSRMLQSRRGRIGNSIEQYLDRQSLDMVWHHDDFLGDEILGSGSSPGMYQIVTGSDGALTIEDATHTNGVAVLRASNGNGSDNEYGGLAMGLNWRGEQNAVCYARIQLDAVATTKVEFGFTDAVGDAGAVNSLASNSFTATDAAVWVFDTDDTANFQFAAADGGTAITKIEGGNAFAATTWYTLMVQLEGGRARGLRFNAAGGLVEDTGFQPAAISDDVDLTPWLFVQLRTGTLDRNVSIDHWGAYQRRSSSN